MRPTRQKDETTWSLTEGLTTGTVRGTDHALSKSGNHAISTDQNAACVLGGGFIRFIIPLLNKIQMD